MAFKHTIPIFERYDAQPCKQRLYVGWKFSHEEESCSANESSKKFSSRPRFGNRYCYYATITTMSKDSVGDCNRVHHGIRCIALKSYFSFRQGTCSRQKRKKLITSNSGSIMLLLRYQAQLSLAI